MSNGTGDARVFRLQAEYRRCGIYVWIGSVAYLVTAIAVDPFVRRNIGGGQGADDKAVIGGLLLVAATVLWVVLWRWRLRVDGKGIARRRFRRWYVWPWKAFQTGQVRQGHMWGTYNWLDAAWTWRSLRLQLIAIFYAYWRLHDQHMDRCRTQEREMTAWLDSVDSLSSD